MQLILLDEITTCCALHLAGRAYLEKKDPERILSRSPLINFLFPIYGIFLVIGIV